MIILTGIYCDGHGTVAKPEVWKDIKETHAHEFPEIRKCVPGTFNIELRNCSYTPPDEAKYRGAARALGRADGNHISPRAKVTAINRKNVTCWLYHGGHEKEPVLELLSCAKLSEILKLNPGDGVELVIKEMALGTAGMPCAPTPTPPRS